MDIRGIIYSIEEFAINDGPGVRTTVFLKGCPLRCQWCHNPESQRREPETMVKQGRAETCGYEISASELSARLLRNEEIFRMMEGGVTFTGGEPLMQADFLCAVLQPMRGRVSTAIETSGYAAAEVFSRVVDMVDLVLMDVKHADDATHRHFTGVSNVPILANLERLKRSGKPFVARIPLIPGVNDTLRNMQATASLLADAEGLRRVELLRYNKLAGAKYPMVGREYRHDFNDKQAPEVHTEPFQEKNIKTLVL